MNHQLFRLYMVKGKLLQSSRLKPLPFFSSISPKRSKEKKKKKEKEPHRLYAVKFSTSGNCCLTQEGGCIIQNTTAASYVTDAVTKTVLSQLCLLRNSTQTHTLLLHFPRTLHLFISIKKKCFFPFFSPAEPFGCAAPEQQLQGGQREAGRWRSQLQHILALTVTNVFACMTNKYCFFH